ncbi:hypothetical protein RH858_06730 [Halalkaliarchaeum sp. AArc-GB]|uniref:DUF7500 family protein n=1 Tax=Halalkaliarchaeum sp. AArc-GB TaxID=3074078 RepID=UPI0028603CAC|nr:hypothetical protein [Halalkaliarchaeum sp. AArc-GB]MDR5672844.1 hypothetical protein [Halalkaliarchaeum sp. AArc-GB]
MSDDDESPLDPEDIAKIPPDADEKEGPAFDPDDLDFSEDKRVEELDEGRYVVSASDDPPNVPPEGLDDLDDGNDADDGTGDARNTTRNRSRSDPRRQEVTAGDVSRWLAASFTNDGFGYGFDATLSTEDDVVRHRMVSNDVTATFDTLVTWFVRNVGEDAPPPEALGILLAAAETPVQYPPGTLLRYVERHDLSPDDPIADLLAVAEAHGGLRIEGDGRGNKAGGGNGRDDR